MEKKLEEYRAKKRREEKINDLKMNVKHLFFKEKLTPSTSEIAEPLIEQTDDDVSLDQCSTLDSISDIEDDDSCNCCTYVNIIRYLLYFIIWACLYAVFIELEFGIVYLVTSSIVLMYLNTRTKPKRKDEVSAYSVFNRNCQSIDGTLKAEQIEKQLLFR